MTGRLRLRRLRPGDAARVRELMGDWDVAKQTGDIPYPYSDAAARDWIAREAWDWARGIGCTLAIEDLLTGEFIGAVSLRLQRPRVVMRRGEVGYWIGKPYWGEGLGTEAVTAAVSWFSDIFRVRRIDAVTFADNSGSAGVLRKLGFKLTRRETRFYPARGGQRQIHRYTWARCRPLPPRPLLAKSMASKSGASKSLASSMASATSRSATSRSAAPKSSAPAPAPAEPRQPSWGAASRGWDLLRWDRAKWARTKWAGSKRDKGGARLVPRP